MDPESETMKRLLAEESADVLPASLLDEAFETSHGRYTYDEVRAAMQGEPYPMSLVGKDAKLVEAAVNQGIDAHLEACFSPDRGDIYEWKDRRAGKTVMCVALDCTISPESLPVLLRRLAKLSYEEPADEKATELADAADTLVNVILQALEILRD